MSLEQNKAAMMEIEAVIKKYDLQGFVILTDGKGQTEFLNSLPSWTIIFPMENQQGIRIKTTHLEQEQKQLFTEKTINAVVSIKDMLELHNQTYHIITALLAKHFEIQVTEGVIVSNSTSKH